MTLSKSIFLEEWFSYHSQAGIRAELHGRESAPHETMIVIKLLSRLLVQNDLPADIRQAIRYFSRCIRERERSFSQIFQDLWVLEMLADKKEGYFVEFGACDGVTLSNTLLLERDYGWRGLLAEPNPVWHERLHKERNCEISELCVSSRSGEIASFSSVTAMPELSRLTGIVPSDVHERNGNRAKHDIIDVKTISLLNLLEQHDAPTHIDYLSIDTEGSELDILQDFDFSRYSIKLITVEHAGESEKRENIKVLLEANGYQRWWPEFSRWDDWYLLK